MEISLAAEKIFSIGNIEVTNSILTAFIVVLLIVLGVIVIGRKLNFANPGKLQIVLEMVTEGLISQISDVLGMDRTKKIFNFVFTFFVFILISNLFGLLPFVPAVGFEHKKEEATHEAQALEIVQTVQAEEVSITEEEQFDTISAPAENSVATETTAKAEEIDPNDVSLGTCLKTKNCFLTTAGVKQFEGLVHLFRAPTSDLSMTAALAIISVVMTNVLGVVSLKLSYFKKFFNFTNPINAIVGILELISEFSRVISFSFRLFGNIFAGETLLTVITNLSFGIATLPFLLLEMFVAFIQAFVFFMLTSIFIGLASTKHEAGH